jgi:hypothetical protein
MKTMLIIILLAARAAAQDNFSLAWATIDGGGGRSTTPGEFTLAGSSVGQFEAGAGSRRRCRNSAWRSPAAR